MAPDIPLPPGELQRLAECILEPIRFPGAIQPHGALLAVDEPTLVITHASENTAQVLGVDAIALLGRPLGDLLDAATIAALHAVHSDASDAGNPTLVTIGDNQFDVIVRQDGDRVLIEFEPFYRTPQEMILATRGALRRLSSVRTVAELWEQTAIEVRRITGYDRVMVYHFHPDQHGEVVAESRADDMEPYLGLHYPASDIPAQARELYVTKVSRLIVSSTAEGAAVLADANRDAPASIDLSAAELRAVSPHHLQFMRNMGQASTFSLSLVRGGQLVGMITCAHRTERRLPYNIRDGLELLSNQVSLQLGAMREIEQLGQRNEVRELRAALVAQVARTDDLPEALLRQHITLLDLIPAEGAAIRLGDRVETIGEAPATVELHDLARRLAAAGSTTDLVTETLSADVPGIAAGMPGVAGLLVRPLGGDGDYLAWFRGERRHTVEWLGDMSPSNRATPLSPRNSFSAWAEEVGGTSAPWDGLEREARELARDLQATLLHRAEALLADLALQDALTGLPNRRLLMDRLEQEIARVPRGRRLAVLFIDLDEFKRINDSFGHSAGDEALRHAAAALRAAARAEDTVARLGGDEFVVLCNDVDESDARSLAQRMLDTIAAAPVAEAIGLPDPTWTVSASVGLALANRGADASHVLSAADSAMYRAKLAGKHRVSD